jgi:hypothetical protein
MLPALAFVIALSLGIRCERPPSILVSSDPANGATNVARTAWVTLRFARNVPAKSKKRFVLFCDDAPIRATSHVVAPDTLVLNPLRSLPPDAACELALPGVGGRQFLRFATAPVGPPSEVIYDRRDRNAPLPFPDDFFLVPDASTPTGLRAEIEVPDHSPAVESLLGGMASHTTQLDGFSPIGNLSVQLSSAPDPLSLPLTLEASLDPVASVGLFDLTPGSATYGERVPFDLTIRSDAFESQPVSHSLVLFPGIYLAPTGRYGLVVTNRVLSEDGEPFAPSDFFVDVLTDAGSGPEAVHARPLALEVVDALEALEPLPIPRDDLALAVRVTVRSTDDIPRDVLAMREDVYEAPASFDVTSVVPGSGSVAAIVSGTFQAPSWRIGPFFERDADGLPVVVDTVDLPFTLALPMAAEEGYAPIVMYQHGNPGTAEASVPVSAETFLAPEGFAVAGITDAINRVAPTLDAQQFLLFFTLLSVGDLADFDLQTLGEQLAFLQLLGSLGDLDLLPLGSPDGIPDLDPNAIVYEGISAGSTHGQRLMAYAPEVLAAGLVVGAARFAELLEHQDRTRPVGQSFLTEVLPLFVSGIRPEDLWMGISLFQMVADRQDGHSHVAFAYRNPLVIDGTIKKPSILVLEAVNDAFTRNNSTRSLASLLGPIPHLAPMVEAVSYLPAQAAPIQANVAPDTTAAFVQFLGGHVGPQNDPEPRELRVSSRVPLGPAGAWLGG